MDPNFDGRIELYHNNLTSIVGLPSRCKRISIHEVLVKTLVGMPGHVDGEVYLDVPSLRSLDYAPAECGMFNMSTNGRIRKDK